MKKPIKKEKTKKQKMTPADKLEENIRLAGLEAQITQLINDIQNVELNALWCDTEEGEKAKMEEHGYTEEQLKGVLGKQEANRLRLRAKADLLKVVYNDRLNT